ncbi:ABC-type transport auxiliary lipoprotein family protein [Polymorphum gilvum]|uniref:Putative ABC transporter protein n=1 Tax=Polymorphum gilvum (strain LMG 25793 / CGMCC 1.9160 / SL003B-26A1) TaxID=991905 RepID=F2J3B7_POLGS|nr:ABC-type transport auxiliary lipoprotein family protein [Polymorphum gilvum]ADZ69924.1 Putative ABC transporter protein [Polymorphum gilvum SL003B-26A1]
MDEVGKGLGRRSLLALAGVGLLLGGCASTAPSALYGLTAPDDIADGRSRPVQVLVPAPRALKALDTGNIAVVDKGPAYSYFPQAAWADTLPNVVQAKLVQTLENTGRLRGVGLPGEGLLIDFQLQTDLRSFELNIDGPDRAVVEIAAKLINDRNGRTVASRVFTAVVPAGGTTVDRAVAAMNRAADQVFREIAVWVLDKV